MKKKIIFTGGGTGGHVYPALAIIEKLKEEGHDIGWIGSSNGIEAKIIKNENIKFYSVPSGKLRRYFSLLNFIDIFKIISGVIVSFFILLFNKPDLLFSKGGYVTVPPVFCAKILGIKTITHESDYSPGLATRINSRLVNKILLPYKDTAKYFAEGYKHKLIITGNPVRAEFYNPSKERGLSITGFTNGKPLILVLGGSLGAKEINDLLITNKNKITKKYNVYHQMGSANYIKIDEESYKTVDYINSNISDLIKAADIVVSRSGAGAVWEISTVGTPAVYIPFTVGSRGDQVLNAEYFKKEGVAEILSGSKINYENLEKALLLLNSKYVEDNSNKFDKYKKINSVDKICTSIKEIL